MTTSKFSQRRFCGGALTVRNFGGHRRNAFFYNQKETRMSQENCVYVDNVIKNSWDAGACTVNLESCKILRNKYHSGLKKCDRTDWLKNLSRRAYNGGETAVIDDSNMKQGLFHWEVYGLGHPSAITIFSDLRKEIDRVFAATAYGTPHKNY